MTAASLEFIPFLGRDEVKRGTESKAGGTCEAAALRRIGGMT